MFHFTQPGNIEVSIKIKYVHNNKYKLYSKKLSHYILFEYLRLLKKYI